MKSRIKESLAERASEYFGLPGGIVSNMPRIEVSGGRQIYIEQHRGVIEYSRDEISVNTLKSVIKIRGEGLEIKAMTSDEILISGRLYGIEFE